MIDQGQKNTRARGTFRPLIIANKELENYQHMQQQQHMHSIIIFPLRDWIEIATGFDSGVIV